MNNLSNFEVLENDYGIRPAGANDECFYCHQKVGTPHNADCVIINNRVKVKLTLEVDGYCWCPSQSDAKYNIENKDYVLCNLIENGKYYNCDVNEIEIFDEQKRCIED